MTEGECFSSPKFLYYFDLNFINSYFYVKTERQVETRERNRKMKVPMIRVLIVLAMISLVSAYPIGLAQTAENKGRGRSYPLIISHYSNVRNSKYDSPPATTEVTPTTTTTAAAAVITIKEESTDLKVDDIKEPTSLVNTDEINPTADAAADESKKSEEKKDDHVTTTTTAVPNMVTTDSAAAAAIVSKNESISVATEAVAEDSLLVSKVSQFQSTRNLFKFFLIFLLS